LFSFIYLLRVVELHHVYKVMRTTTTLIAKNSLGSGLYLHLPIILITFVTLILNRAHHLVSTPSAHCLTNAWLGSVLPRPFDRGFTEFDGVSISHRCLMSPIEPHVQLLHLPAISTFDTYRRYSSSIIQNHNFTSFYAIFRNIKMAQ
jgi:hypothetical protein